MSRYLHIIYIVLAAAVIVSYSFIKSRLLSQEPYDETVILSNLTLNYVLVVVIVGAIVPKYLKKRYLPKAPTITIVPIAIVVAAVLLIVLKTLGMEMRF